MQKKVIHTPKLRFRPQPHGKTHFSLLKNEKQRKTPQKTEKRKTNLHAKKRYSIQGAIHGLS